LFKSPNTRTLNAISTVPASPELILQAHRRVAQHRHQPRSKNLLRRFEGEICAGACRTTE
jgi:hypothetical protein